MIRDKPAEAGYAAVKRIRISFRLLLNDDHRHQHFRAGVVVDQLGDRCADARTVLEPTGQRWRGGGDSAVALASIRNDDD